MGDIFNKEDSHVCVKKCAAVLERLGAGTGPGGVSLVAVSGGADSVALLHILRELYPEISLHVLHFNHQLRGAESERDEEFVRRLAQEMDLSLAVGRGDVIAEASKSKTSLEMAARGCRYRFFAEKARELQARFLFMGHHAGDQTELFFLRLLRGASSQGLKGMRAVSDFPGEGVGGLKVVRPLLGCSREEILDYLRGRKISWVEDSSNSSGDFLRNRIRNELLPLLEQSYSPSLGRTLLRTMEILGQESDYLSEEIERLKREGIPFESWHTALQRRAVAEALIERGLQPTLDAVDYFIQNPGKAHSCRGELYYRQLGSWRLSEVEKADFGNLEEIRVSLGGELQEISLPGEVALRVRFEVLKPGEVVDWKDKPEGVEYFDLDRVGDFFTLRHWREGDRFQPIGMRDGTRKLQDIFVDRKVAEVRRHQLWLGETAQGVIFWVEGLRIGEACKITESTKQILKLTSPSQGMVVLPLA